MASAESYAYTFMTGLGMFLVLLPLPWHWQARNFGTLLYVFWAFVGNLIYFVNSIVWRGNLSNPSPIWCDISTKLMIGLGVAYSAASLCINRRLFNIATSRHVSSSPNQRRNQALVDIAIALGIPFLSMALHIIVQGHRYDIYEDVGCIPSVYESVLSIVLISMWPTIIGCISAVYCVLSINAFWRQRRTFKALIGKSNSTVNLSRYFRLMALAGTDILISVPLSTYLLRENLKAGVQPWISWSWVHWGFSKVYFFPTFVIKESGQWPAVEINRWAHPVCAIIFFIFFGLAGESLAAYKRFFARIPKLFKRGDKFAGGQPLPSTPGSSSWQSRFTEPPTPISGLKSARTARFARRDSDLESAMDFDTSEKSDSLKAAYTPPSLPPRALSLTSLRDLNFAAKTGTNADVYPPEPPSPAIFDIRRFSSSLTAPASGHDTAPTSATATDLDFTIDLFPFPSALPLTAQSLSGQFRNSLPATYSFGDPSPSASHTFTLTSPPTSPLADAPLSDMYRHSTIGFVYPATPK